MLRERNKLEKSWREKAKEELANQEELTIKRAYELGKIRGQKETIEKACEWLLSEDGLSLMYQGNKTMDKDFIILFRKAMKE